VLDALIARLGLAPHPEGGFYRETFRSPEVLATRRGPRPASTAILFLLPAGTFSALHRVAADEVWHHYDGDALELSTLDDAGARADVRLGHDLEAGQLPQATVRAGLWQAARPVEGGAGFALCGCTVAPGFTFEDFELGARDALLAAFPDHAELVRAFTR
jgi:predicted cupin superfamily sugar epimerase